jgi:hypothetical protein
MREGAPVSARHAVFACGDALGAAGVGLSVARNGQIREPLVASAPVAEELEELQFTLGQGPGMDATVTRAPVFVTDLTGLDALRRWPVFAAAAADRGIRGMFAFPVAVGAALVGVLDVYRPQAGLLGQEELADTLVFADATLTLVLDDRAGVAPGPAGFPEPMISASRVQVHQATGMVAARLGVPVADALVMLRAHAFSHDQRLSELAGDLVAHRVRLDLPSGPSMRHDRENPPNADRPSREKNGEEGGGA